MPLITIPETALSHATGRFARKNDENPDQFHAHAQSAVVSSRVYTFYPMSCPARSTHRRASNLAFNGQLSERAQATISCLPKTLSPVTGA